MAPDARRRARRARARAAARRRDGAAPPARDAPGSRADLRSALVRARRRDRGHALDSARPPSSRSQLTRALRSAPRGGRPRSPPARHAPDGESRRVLGHRRATSLAGGTATRAARARRRPLERLHRPRHLRGHARPPTLRRCRRRNHVPHGDHSAGGLAGRAGRAETAPHTRRASRPELGRRAPSGARKRQPRRRRAATRSAARCPPLSRRRRPQASAPRRRHCARVARHHAPHPALRGARRRDVRQGQGRRLPAPGDRRGGDDRRLVPRAERHRLPDLHLSLARPRPGARHRARPGDGRAVRPRGRRVPRPRRLDAHVRPRAPLHGRLRDRRRQPPARGGDRRWPPTTGGPRT